MAACLYIACRQEDKPRTVKGIESVVDELFSLCRHAETLEFASEICSVANGATKKEIGRAKEFIMKQLELEMGQSVEIGTIHAADFMVMLEANQDPNLAPQLT